MTAKIILRGKLPATTISLAIFKTPQLTHAATKGQSMFNKGGRQKLTD
jgi:hypothetical protein